MRILFTANPLIGHVYPMLPLMQAARDAGHDVVIATGAEMVAELRARGFDTWTVGPSFADAAAELQQASTEPAETHDEQLARDAVYLFGRPAVARFHELMPRAAAWQPDLVVSEVTEVAGGEIAHAVGAVAVTHGFGTHVPRLRDLAGVLIDHVSTALGTQHRRREIGSGVYLDPCPAGLQADQLEGGAVWPIRPGVGHTRPEDRLPAAFLALPERPVVYVTLGTVFNAPELVREVLDAIEDLPISIAVTTGPGVDPALLGARPAHVVAAEFVPQSLILPYASAVVSHAGSGTMLGALASGLPLVCLPRGADQFANADRVQAVGAGIRLLPEEVTPERLRSAVRAVLYDSTYARVARDLRAQIAAMPSPDAVLESLTALVEPERMTA